MTKAARADRSDDVKLRKPNGEDGPRVTALVAASPPLDPNSAYCNLLQCTDFRDTCVVAERDGELLGWLSGYRVPAAPHRLFIWQIAISSGARGMGLATRMVEELLARPDVAGATEIVTTITDTNDASWGLFRSLARRLGAELTRSSRFDRETHFAGQHDTEWEARIAPLPQHGE